MSDVEEHARLLHMEQRDAGARDMKAFAFAIREEYPTLDLAQIMTLWSKYRGIDARVPTHNMDTGEPFRS